MFEWVLNLPLNTITYMTYIFSWCFQIKVNDFFNFFSTINFRYQHLPEAKAYLEPQGFFTKYFCCCKIHKKTPVLESHFNKVTGLYPATSLKERTPTQVFSGEFCEILKTSFLQKHLQATTSVLRKKCFINKIVKNPLRKGKKLGTACKKNNHTGKTKNHYLHQYNIENTSFQKQCNPIEDYLLQKIISHLRFEKIVFYLFIYTTVTTTLRD